MGRLRIRFRRGEQVKYISHLDIMRFWERAFRRAQVSLAYTEGYSPHPKISLAVPLSVGVTGESELMDVYTSGRVTPHWLKAAVSQQLPAGFELLDVYGIAPMMPSLQSQVRFAEYTVELDSNKDRNEIKAVIAELLAAEHLPWSHKRDTGQRNYDIRALIDDIWVIDCQAATCTIGMRLRCDNRGSGRPEQVAAALGFTGYPRSIQRNRLVIGT